MKENKTRCFISLLMGFVVAASIDLIEIFFGITEVIAFSIVGLFLVISLGFIYFYNYGFFRKNKSVLIVPHTVYVLRILLKFF